MSLHLFCKEIYVPVYLIVDAHQYQTTIKLKRFFDKVGNIPKILEKGTPWANRDELYTGILKEAVFEDMNAS